CHCRDCVDMGSALFSWENALINLLAQFTVMTDYHSATWTAEGLMGGETDNVGNPDGRGDFLCSNQTGDVRNIRQQPGTDFICDFTEFLPVWDPGVRGIARDDDLGFSFLRDFEDFGIVQPLGFWIDRIRMSI